MVHNIITLVKAYNFHGGRWVDGTLAHCTFEVHQPMSNTSSRRFNVLLKAHLTNFALTGGAVRWSSRVAGDHDRRTSSLRMLGAASVNHRAPAG